MDVNDLVECIETSCSLYDSYNQGIISYIKQLPVPHETKQRLLHLVENDNYNDYMEMGTKTKKTKNTHLKNTLFF